MTLEQRPRVLLVDADQQSLVELRRFVETAGCEVVGSALNGEAAIEMACAPMTDLVVMDLRLPGPVGAIDVMSALRERHVGVVCVIAGGDLALVDGAVSLGARGYIIRPFVQAQIVCALKVALSIQRDLHADHLTSSDIGPGVWKKLLSGVELLARQPVSSQGARAASVSNMGVTLTPREAELVCALISYRHLSLAAEALHISHHTARNHLKSVFRKLDVHSQEDLIRLLLDVARTRTQDPVARYSAEGVAPVS